LIGDAFGIFENRRNIPFTPTFSPKLNKVLGGGLRSSGTYILAGGPGSGKTTFALNLIDGILSEKVEKADERIVIYLSAELIPQLVLDRMASNKLGLNWVDVIDLNEANNPDMYAKYQAYAKTLAKRLFILSPQECLKYEEHITAIKTHLDLCYQGDTPPIVLVVDYIQDLARGFVGKYRDSRDATSQLSRELRESAQKHDCPMIIISSTGRQFYNGVEEVADESLIAAAKDSGEVEFDANAVIYLKRRKTADGDYAELVVAKNRFGEAPTSILFKMEAGHGRYTETDVEVKNVMLIDAIKKIYTLVRSNPGKFSKPTAIAKTLNINWKDVANALNLKLGGMSNFKLIDNHNGVNGYFAIVEPTTEVLD